MEDEYDSAQQAFLVGRYLKENGLSETLECFLRETPIKMVPKMQENMRSLSQIVKEFRQLLKDREELKDKRRRMQQYEEILNLLFEELRDVYNFQTPPVGKSASTSACKDGSVSTASTTADEGNMSTSITPEHQFIPPEFVADDAQLIKDFCLQNSNKSSGTSLGKIVPVVLPKSAMVGNKMSKGLSGVTHKESSSNIGETEIAPSARPEGHSRAQMLEHQYNRIREHRRLNRHSRHRLLDKNAAPAFSLVAYSSLPLSSSKAYPSSCAQNSRHGSVNSTTQNRCGSKKHIATDDSWIDEQNNTWSCAHLQSASFKKSSLSKQPLGTECSLEGSSLDCYGNTGLGPEGSAHMCHGNDAKLNQAGFQVQNDGIVADDKAAKFKPSLKSDQNLGEESIPSFQKHEVTWSVFTSPKYTHTHTTTSTSMRARTVDSTANAAMTTENDDQWIERDCHDRYVACGDGLQYKAFLREKFYSTRCRQSTNTHHQQVAIHHHEEKLSGSPASVSRFDDICDDISRSHRRVRSSNDTTISNGGEFVDAAVLATETANLLERLLPLVADPDTMQSFINNLDSLSPHPSPRDHHTHDRWHLHSTHPEREKTSTSRLQETEERERYEGSEMLEDANNMNDDASVLAELEEAVGKTVDDILRRYILVSPPPHPPPPSSSLPLRPLPPPLSGDVC